VSETIGKMMPTNHNVRERHQGNTAVFQLELWFVAEELDVDRRLAIVAHLDQVSQMSTEIMNENEASL
jgi:hypothetical protein